MQSLTNAILEKVPQVDVLQRVAEISTGKRVRLAQIQPHELTTGSEDVDATMQQFDLTSLDVNELLMQTLAQMQKETCQETMDHEEIVHDQ